MKNKYAILTLAAVLLAGASAFYYFKIKKFIPTEESASDEILIVIKD